MAVTMDRYLAICKPFLAKKYNLSSWRKARKVSVIVVLFDICYNLPRFWEFEYFQLETDIDNLTAYVPVPTWLRTNFYYNVIYVHLSYVIGLFLGSAIYLIVFNILIYREASFKSNSATNQKHLCTLDHKMKSFCTKIRRSTRLRKDMTAQTSISMTSQDISLAYMLFGIVTVFIVCQIIPASHASYRYASGDFETDSYVPEVELMIYFFFVLNSSVNFLIYCVSGKKFRNAMFVAFKCKRWV